MKPNFEYLILGLFLINLTLSAGRALPEKPSSLANRSEFQSLAIRGPVIVGGKGTGTGGGKGGGKTGGGGKGGAIHDDGAPGPAVVEDKPVDYEDFTTHYVVAEEAKAYNAVRDGPQFHSTLQTDLVDLGSRLGITTELSQPFTTVMVNGHIVIDGSPITIMSIPAKGSLNPEQKTVIIGEWQFAESDILAYHDGLLAGKLRNAPEPGYRSQTDIQATILIQNKVKPDIVIQRGVVNEQTQVIIKEAVDKFGEGSDHATLTLNSGKEGMTKLFNDALKSDNLRPANKFLQRYPTYFEGRVPIRVDVIWGGKIPDDSVISMSLG